VGDDGLPDCQVIDPEIPHEALTDDVLKLRYKYAGEVFLVNFYDTKRTW